MVAVSLRGVYTDKIIAKCLDVAGYGIIAASMKSVSQHIQMLRCKTRIETGFSPEDVIDGRE